MEKPEQHIDHVFRNKLENAIIPPPAFVWTNVEKELQRRKKPPLFWWWSSSLVLLLAVSGAYVLLNDNQSAGVVSLTKSEKQAVQQNTVIISDSGYPKNTTAAATAAESPENNRQTALPATAPFTPYTKKSVSGTIGQDNYAKGGGQPAPDMTNNLGAASIPAITTPITINIPELQQNEAANSKTVMPLLPGLSTDFLELKIKHPAGKRWPTKVAKKKKKDENCYDFAAHRTVLMVDAYAGPETADRSFVAENAENKPYLTKRVQTEGRGWGFNGGLRATAVFREHFTASAGIEYHQFTEVFSYVDPTSIEFDVHVEIDPNTGATTFDTSDIRFGESRVKSYNRYGLLDVPVALGYEVRQGRGGIRFQGGAALNLLFHKRGTILSPDTGKPVSFTPDKPGAIDVFRANAGLSVQGSMQFFWSYQPRTRFFAEPYFKKILDPVTLDSHPVSTRYNLWGVRFGVTKIF